MTDDLAPAGAHYTLVRADGAPLGDDKSCIVQRSDGGRFWVRTSYWPSQGKPRKHRQWFKTLAEALASGVAWAQRRAQAAYADGLAWEERLSETDSQPRLLPVVQPPQGTPLPVQRVVVDLRREPARPAAALAANAWLTRHRSELAARKILAVWQAQQNADKAEVETAVRRITDELVNLQTLPK